MKLCTIVSWPIPFPVSLSDRLERLARATPELISEVSLEGVLQRAADLAAEVIGARYAAVGMLSLDGRTLESFTVHGMTAEERDRIGSLPKGHGILGLVIHEGRSVRMADLMQHPASYGFPPNHPPMQSFLGVPIRRQARGARRPVPHREAGRHRVHRGGRAPGNPAGRARCRRQSRTPGCTRRVPGCWRRSSGCTGRASGSSRW